VLVISGGGATVEGGRLPFCMDDVGDAEIELVSSSMRAPD